MGLNGVRGKHSGEQAVKITLACELQSIFRTKSSSVPGNWILIAQVEVPQQDDESANWHRCTSQTILKAKTFDCNAPKIIPAFRFFFFNSMTTSTPFRKLVKNSLFTAYKKVCVLAFG